MRSPKTSTLIRRTGSNIPLRLLAADRAFLRDLARVQILSAELADRYHYAHLKGGCRRPLGRLEAAGLITRRNLGVAGASPATLYQFASDSVARAFGSALPATGARRSDYHELLTSRAYFALGCPEDFRLAARMTEAEVERCSDCRPDAVYTDPGTGDLVMVEADSGHYTTRQIRTKVERWAAAGLRQVWAQPVQGAGAAVPRRSGIGVLRL